ncbi:MAG: rhodanese-like domain-containing protein [Alicyclobacillus macrosporangiidus]|uniref:rhodanese-like domain-containing protein n=1 Tax=Alicyclobacillus macrosporangiidus TaxID=392015 RepID=UPI0026F08AA7|nr:rhodanese-like domain-containing protein [Alicyclobacillus macrosporangiidus]MCL6599784.1 rhodanese-like domain-containing protein [Alicyclobacillus macrosporangiidus]
MTWIWLLVVLVVVGSIVYRLRPAKGVKSIRADELRQMLRDRTADVQYVDVREPGEFRQGHIDGFRNIPLGQLRSRLGELDKGKPVVVMCHSGMRSTQAARLLAKQGFMDVRNLSGGISAWNAHRGR